MVADVAKKQEYKIKYQGKLLWRKRPSFNFCNFIIQSLGAACASTHPQSMRRRKPLLSFPLIITELYTILVLYFSSRRHGNKIRLFCWRTYKGALSPSSILHSQEKCLCANPNRSRNIISLCPYVSGNTHSFIYIDLLTAKRNLIGSLYEATAIDRFSITFSFLWQMPDGEFYCRRDVIVCASIFDSYVWRWRRLFFCMALLQIKSASTVSIWQQINKKQKKRTGDSSALYLPHGDVYNTHSVVVQFGW